MQRIGIFRGAAVLAGLQLFAGPTFAADGDALEAENKRLKEEIAQLRQELAVREGSSTGPASAAAPSGAATSRVANESPPRAAPAGQVGDADLIEAVTVTALRIKEEAPAVSVSAVTGEELEKFHVNNFRDLANRIGNVRTSWQNPNTASIFIRGVGWASGAGALDPSVGVTVDGVSHGISSISALSNYLDVESVEVTRGPVGFSGGKSANMGSVNIETAKPKFSPEARFTATLGELNTVIATAVVGGPIIEDKLAARLTVNRETADGPFKNANDTTYTWRNTDRTNVRAQLRFTPTERFEANLSADFTPTGREICENCFWFNSQTPSTYDWIDTVTGQAGAVNLAEDPSGKFQRRWFLQNPDYNLADYLSPHVNTIGEYPNTYETRGGTLNLRYEINDQISVRSISGFRDYEFSQGAGSHTGFEWLREPRGSQTAYEQLSQEFRVEADLTESLSGTGGLYYFKGRFPYWTQTERYGTDGGAWYATAAQYAVLDPVIAGQPNGVDPAGRQLLLNSVHGLITQRFDKLDNESTDAYASLKWQTNDDFTVDLGLRVGRETRNFTGWNTVLSDGYGAELNPAQVNDVTLNGFANTATGALSPGNSAAQLALADFVAQKYFGVATYGALTAAQRAQVAAAKGIRAARIGGLYQTADAGELTDTLVGASLGISFRASDTVTYYASYKSGEKPGITQIVGTFRDPVSGATGGKSLPASPETTAAYELGFKTNLFENTLTFNGAFFLQDIDDYLQRTRVYDAVQTQLNGDGNPAYVVALGNVPKVRTKGFEFDGAYTGIPYTTLRLSGAYTIAKYEDFPAAPVPPELGGRPAVPYFDASGETLPGAPRFSGNLFGDFSYPWTNDWVFRANVNYNFTSSYNANTQLSRYAVTDSLGVTDLSFGIGRADGLFDVSLVAKNVFDEDTGIPLTWNSYKPGIPRWIGLTLRTSLF